MVQKSLGVTFAVGELPNAWLGCDLAMGTSAYGHIAPSGSELPAGQLFPRPKRCGEDVAVAVIESAASMTRRTDSESLAMFGNYSS
jgi:hypothetical protein